MWCCGPGAAGVPWAAVALLSRACIAGSAPTPAAPTSAPTPTPAQLLHELVANDGAAGDSLGESVAVSSDGARLVAGACMDDQESGSAYVFDGATGVQLHKLVAEDGAAGDRFGVSVAVSSDGARVAVGATNYESSTPGGSAYVFDGATGAQLNKLWAEDAKPADGFGISVAMSFDGTRVAVGSCNDWHRGDNSGSVYMFDGATGAQLLKFTALDTAEYDWFGMSVAMSSDGAQVVVGAFSDDDLGRNSGSAYVFDGYGRQLLKLRAQDGAPYDWFGVSVAMSSDGTRVVVGAYYDDSMAGSVYTFDGATGVQLRKLVAESGADGDRFGRVVAVSSDGARVAVGATNFESSTPGSAYVFDGATGAELYSWLFDSMFGWSVAMSSDGARLAVGAPGGGSSADTAGSAFLFDVMPGTAPTPAPLPTPAPPPMPAPPATTTATSSTTVTSSATTEQQSSEGSIAAIAGVAAVPLACIALGCLLRRRCRGRSQAPERELVDVEIAEPGRGVPGQGAEPDGLLQSMGFWFMPVDEFMRMPTDKPLPRHQVLRDMGLLVKREMTVEDVLSGSFAADTAAVSHRWPTAEHFDPECSKVQKLREILASTPSIKFLWIDWVSAPQWHGGGRTDAEEEEFRLILENILTFIFLGCRVIVLYERIYNQRFWPNVECWIATKMPTEDGLVPASEDRFRLQVHGIDSASGRDKASRTYVLGTWRSADAQQAIHFLSQDDILVTNARDKEVNLKVVASLDERIRSHHVLHI